MKQSPEAQTAQRYRWLHIGILAVVAVIAYLKIFHAGFMYWDDGEYVQHNPDINGITGSHIASWFSNFYVGNYQPVTMLSYALDHALGGSDATVYHVTSLLLHIACASLVYLIVNRLQKNEWIGFAVALLFALHPSQTEAVSWIAERKTVVCALFYLLAMWQYLRYQEHPAAKRWVLVVVFSMAAMLSKAIAVTLPFAFLAIDIWQGRGVGTAKDWLRRLPLIAIAIVLGVVAIKGQGSARFLHLHPDYTILDTILYAGYAYVMYLVRLFVPVGISAVYPYPPRDGMLYVYFVLAIGIIALGIVAWRKKWDVLCGSILFYTANIALVLQFLQVGEVLMADRYMYIASTGIWYLAVYYLFAGLQRVHKQALAIGISGAVALVFMGCTFFRNEVWLSDMKFFSTILDEYPTSPVAQCSVGTLYMKMGDYAQAAEHLNLAVQLDPSNFKAWHNKGSLSMREGKAMEALDAFNRCIALNDGYTKAYFSRAMLYQGTGKPDLALADIDKVLAEQPENARAYYIKGDCLERTGNLNGALQHYNQAISFENTEPLFYIRRALVNSKLKQHQQALNDINSALTISHSSAEAMYYRGIIKYQAGISPCEDLQAARAKGYKQADEAIQRLCR